jgi:hypothetical protein
VERLLAAAGGCWRLLAAAGGCWRLLAAAGGRVAQPKQSEHPEIFRFFI